jgi:biotin operon repressor
MSLTLQWTVLKQPHLPAKWKQVMVVLALIAKEDGTGIFVSEEKLAKLLGVHRMTAHKVLRELHVEGLLVMTRRGGRWRTRKGVVGRSAERRIDVQKVIRFDPRFRCSDATTSSDDLVAKWLKAPNLAATSLHDDADHSAPSLHLKTGKKLKTGNNQSKDRQEIPKGLAVMLTAVASDDGLNLSRPSNPKQQQQQPKTKEPV